MAQLCQEFDLYANQITERKRQLLEGYGCVRWF